MFKVITANPIAHDSPDHTHPYGSVLGNPGNEEFNRRLYLLFDYKPISVVDFGCAGGSFIRYCVQDGHLAVGLEGSDEPQKRKLGQWPEYDGKNLFTCDVTEDFTIFRNDELFLADVITSWEFLEHIHPEEIDTVLRNTIKHLKNDGLYICSISSGTEEYCKYVYGKTSGPHDLFPGKGFHHQNQQTPKYWDDKFASFGFVRRDDIKDTFAGQFIRGPGHGCADWAAEHLSKENSPMERQEITLNRVYQYKGIV